MSGSMTECRWLATAVRRLEQSGCEDAAFDARCLLEDLGGLPRGHLPGERPLTDGQRAALERALEQRADGRPLQYILGNWDFLSLSLCVGEGVLIPRPDTECLCEYAALRLRGQDAPAVLDLCAGTGCVGLGIASLCPGARVTAVELSEQAWPYLEENCRRYPMLSVHPLRADVLRDAGRFPMGWDAIVSNPPYIPTADLDHLMREVRHEPRMALDGDGDGLRFYRCMAESWIPRLKPGGFCAVEVGVDQAEEVRKLFCSAGLTAVVAVRDAACIDRVVAGIRS